MIIGVLANDNPQGLLLACRLLGRAHIRVSVGGRLGKILEEGWKLLAEDERGQVQEINTRIMKRGEGNSTKEEEEKSNRDVLWLCDWKDTSTGWYSLSECELLLQASKATDSKTVAMWLVEVCKEDAVIISLQSGLHNARELRGVFGHAGGAMGGNVASDMPLVATTAGRKPAGSLDTTDGVLSRRESASSIYSELEGLDETIDPSERSASPMPPGLQGSGLPSPSSSDSGGRRKALVAFRDEEEKSVDEAKDRGPDQVEDELKEGDEIQPETASINTMEGIRVNVRKPKVLLLAGVLGFGACAIIDDTAKTLSCLLTHQGAIVTERLTRTNAMQGLGRVLVLEHCGFKVFYRANEETNNWLWGDVVWRSFEAYGASLRIARPNDNRSLYELLRSDDTTHRRVYAGLLDEALSALRWQRVELMDPASSPFGLSFRAARSLLLLPQPAFSLCLSLVLLFRFPLQSPVRKDAPYCDMTAVHRYMAAFLNGEVVRIGFEGEVQTPLNQEVLELLSVVTKAQHSGRGSPGHRTPPPPGPTSSTLIRTSTLPELYSMTFFTSVVSCIVLLLAIFIRFVAFVIEVTFFW